MPYDPRTQRLQNRLHAVFPKVGDYWEDHMVGAYLVVGVRHTTQGTLVGILHKKIQLPDGWTWDTEQVMIVTKHVFKDMLSYNYHKQPEPPFDTWADVHPDTMMSFVAEMDPVWLALLFTNWEERNRIPTRVQKMVRESKTMIAQWRQRLGAWIAGTASTQSKRS